MFRYVDFFPFVIDLTYLSSFLVWVSTNLSMMTRYMGTMDSSLEQ